MSDEKTMDYDNLKAEYSNEQRTELRKKQLIHLMQENLQQRCGEDCDDIECLDGKKHSRKSNNVEDLYAIDGCLKSKSTGNKMSENSEMACQKALEQNKYGPKNPYQE